MSTRECLGAALASFDEIMLCPPKQLTEMELQCIREKRVMEMARYAEQLRREIVKERIR